MKIRNRLYISAVISIVLAIVLVVTVVLSSHKVTQEMEKHNLAMDMNTAVLELDIVTHEYLLHRENLVEQQWFLRYKSMEKVLEEAAKNIRLPLSMLTSYTSLYASFSQVTANSFEIRRLTQEGASQQKIDIALGLEERLIAQLSVTSQSLITDASRLAEEAQAEAMEAQRLASSLTVILMIVLATAITTSSLLVARSISRPLDELTKGTEIIGKRDLEHKVVVNSKDEFGQLAAAFNEMTGSLRTITASRDELDREVAERKQAEEKIQRLNRELEQRIAELSAANKELEGFSYYVSHDLRVPLRAIACFSEIFLEDHAVNLDKEGRRVINVVRDNAKRMEGLIDGLLNFSHLGQKETIKKDIDMEELTRKIVKELKNNSPDEKVEVKIAALPSAYGDETLVHQVLINLISNAIKFSNNKKSSLIEVGARLEKDENIYYVKDNGVGFDMKYSDKLFGVFQRLHSQKEFEGTGVGLALVQRIIHRHGGRVWAEGKVNKGATFYFTLPLRKEKQ